MYKCLDCGHVFDDGEEVRWTETYGEVWAGCPACKGESMEAQMCQGCGEYYAKNDVHEGWCIDCLRDQATPETCLAYINERHLLLDFFIGYYCQSPAPDWHYASSTYRSMVEREVKYLLRCGAGADKRDIITACRLYILEEDGGCGLDDFAGYLNERRSLGDGARVSVASCS